MAIPWDSIRTLVIFFGPILLPKAISWYRSVRSAAGTNGRPIQAASPPVRIALAILFALAMLYLVKSLPLFAPENLFAATDSRLQIPVDVLFNRVLAGRPQNILTETDKKLRAKFVNLESRLLYLQFGPGVMAECPFCTADDPKSYLYYTLPSLLAPHVANLIVLAIVTSPSLTRHHGSQWRTIFTIGACVLAAVDVYLISAYNPQANARHTRLKDLDMFFWSMRSYRLLALASLDAAMGWLLWLSCTNRGFAKPPSPAERVEGVNARLSGVKSRLSALGIVKNTAIRDEELRSKIQGYWTHEVSLMREVMEEREVIEGVNDALSNRINIQNITRDADVYAQSVLQPLRPVTTEAI